MEFVQPIRDIEKVNAMKRYLKERSARDYLLFVAGVNSGLRVSDLLTLTVGDVRDKTHITLREQKTTKERRFVILPDFERELRTYINGRANDEWLFPSRQGDKPITRVQAYRILNDAAKAIGLLENGDSIGTHTLRKTFGYHFYQRTKDIALLQLVFGHSAPSITFRYIGINADVIDDGYRKFGGL